jgi:hypothetical protein
MDSAVRAGSKEKAALWQAFAGLREAEFGNTAAARENTDAALSLQSGSDIKLLAALTLARVGGHGQSEETRRATGEREDGLH